MRKIIPVFVVSLPLLLQGCDSSFNDSEASSLLEVTTQKLEAQDTYPHAYYFGKIEALDSVDITSQVEGYIAHRTFQEGGQVKKGDLLYVIDAAPYQAEVVRLTAHKAHLVAQHNLKTKELGAIDAEQEEPDARKKLVMDRLQAQVQAIGAQIKLAEAELIKAKMRLSHTKIYAPFSGRIGSSNVSVGEFVSFNGRTLTHLNRNQSMYATIDVPERQFLNEWQQMLDAQNPPEISLEFANGSRYHHPGIVTFIDNKVDNHTGNIQVRVQFNNPDHELIPGQSVILHVLGQKPKSKLLLPDAALQTDENGDYVLTVDDKHQVQTHYVEVGTRVDDHWEVTSGLSDGEHVIVEGYQDAKPGSLVSSVEE
ncbi:efflux RND transporter periplasmic adaptor subunit [Vibrio mexicanus]|uniref:efflux RND transporter periplasmic adaptor subunit n=1 Tax=Vibrio mexicanus TaxID=1004326 RepID=UPI00063CA484|nr:efflux RND transporter periplasmic adaptor subunit [Vibrio mexicanus]